ncbi:DoxX family protein [Vibrio fluvialis]|nr:DoxX family protein [Vibrio fluvialis]
MNNVIRNLLISDPLWLFSRLLVTFVFWYDAAGLIVNFNGTKAMMAGFGFHPETLYALLTIVVELIGCLFILFDRYVWLGAGMLSVFTFLTIILVHDFWNMSGIEALNAKLESEEHLTVIGGMIVVSILSVIRREWCLLKDARAAR